MSLDESLRPGAAVADYVLDERLSDAGASQVYRARQPALGRHVMLHVVAAGDDADAEEFLARARTLARIDHPHVLPVYDVGAWNGAAFVASGVPPGRPVPDAVELTSLTPAAAVSVVDQLAGALEALEAAGLRIAPEPADVFLHGNAAEPLAVLAPLTVAPSSASASDSLVELLETLAPQGSGVVASARSAHAERPSAVAAAARAALRRPRRSRRALIAAGAAAAVLTAAGIVAALSRNGSGAPAARASDPPGRIVARIPVGAGAQSIARAGDALWVSTSAGFVRLDPRTNRAVGAPVALPRKLAEDGPSLYGAGANLYAIAHGRVVRLDPRTGRVLAVRRVPGGIAASVAQAGATTWVGVRRGPGDNRGSAVLPLDPLTLVPRGPAVPVGLNPVQLIPDGRAVLAIGYDDGSVTRVEPGREDGRRVQVSVHPGYGALAAGRLWLPDVTGVTSAIAPALDRPASLVTTTGISRTLVAAAGGLWVQVVPTPDFNGRTRLVRVDARTGGVNGRPIDLGTGLSDEMAAAYGDVWIPDSTNGAVIRIHPAAAVPPPHVVRDPHPGRLLTGPSRPGRRSTRLGALRVSLDPGGPGWTISLFPGVVDLRRFDSPAIGFAVSEPTEVFGARGSAHRPRSARDFMATLGTLTDVRRLGPVERITAGGITGLSARFAVAPAAGQQASCGAPCAALASVAGGTYLLERPAQSRVSAFDVRGHVIVVFEDTPDGRSLPRTGAVARTLRLG